MGKTRGKYQNGLSSLQMEMVCALQASEGLYSLYTGCLGSILFVTSPQTLNVTL